MARSIFDPLGIASPLQDRIHMLGVRGDRGRGNQNGEIMTCQDAVIECEDTVRCGANFGGPTPRRQPPASSRRRRGETVALTGPSDTSSYQSSWPALRAVPAARPSG